PGTLLLDHHPRLWSEFVTVSAPPWGSTASADVSRTACYDLINHGFHKGGTDGVPLAIALTKIGAARQDRTTPDPDTLRPSRHCHTTNSTLHDSRCWLSACRPLGFRP